MKLSDETVSKILDTICKRDEDPRSRWIEVKVEIERTDKNEVTVKIVDDYGLVERDSMIADLRTGGSVRLDGMYYKITLD